MDIRSPIAHAHDALREHRVPRVRRLTRMARMAVTSARRDTRHKMACRQTSWHTILPGFQERYLWPLLPLLAIGMDAADNAQELGQGNPRNLKDLRHQPL